MKSCLSIFILCVDISRVFAGLQLYSFERIYKKESIPVGCVPLASVAATKCQCQRGSPSRSGVCPPPPGGDIGPEIPYPHLPPVNRMTDRRLWKHYLPTTNVAGGNKRNRLKHATIHHLTTDRFVMWHWFYDISAYQSKMVPASIVLVSWSSVPYFRVFEDNFSVGPFCCGSTTKYLLRLCRSERNVSSGRDKICSK